MKFTQLVYTGSVVTVTLNRPDLHNAFTGEMIAELQTTFVQLGADARVRAVVLTGAGSSFCAGADLAWMRRSLDLTRDENLADAQRLATMYEVIATLPKPVIGRVNGAAVGGGAGLVACCDIVVAAERAKFGFSEVKLGLVPAIIARYVVPKIGASHAQALFVSGRRFDAGHAQRIGLVHDVVPDSKLDGVVQLVVEDVLTSAPAAIGHAKQLIRAALTLPEEELSRYSVAAIADARTSPEGQEGLRAFIEKRKPSWAVPHDERH